MSQNTIATQKLPKIIPEKQAILVFGNINNDYHPQDSRSLLESESDSFLDDESEAEEEEEEEEIEEEDFDKSASVLDSKMAHSAKQSYSKKGAASLTKLKKTKLIHFDSVNIPKGDKTSIDKFVSTRRTTDGVEQVLTKYKVTRDAAS